jgi:hypothetical protein
VRRFVAVASALAWSVTCGAASAATVSSVQTIESGDRGERIPIRNYTITAGPGEQNRMELSMGAGGLLIHDSAGLTPEAPCVAVDPATVTCPANGFRVKATLGDGDDTLTETSGGAVEVDGEDGDDVVTAGPSNSRLSGGPGNDQLTGNVVAGGPGDDVLAGRWLDFSDHTAAVSIDLAAGIGRAAGEHDRLAPGFAFVYGGSGPDVIRTGDQRVEVFAGAGDDTVYGGDDADTLRGGPGADRLLGGAGDDYLFGDAGDDVLDGAAGRDELRAFDGADTILARDGERDLVDCSQTRLENDRATVDLADLTYGCARIERIGARRLEAHAVLRTGPRTRVFVASCPQAARVAACAGRIRFGKRQRTEQASFRVAPGRRERIRITLRHKQLYSPRVILRTGQRLTWIADLRP